MWCGVVWCDVSFHFSNLLTHSPSSPPTYPSPTHPQNGLVTVALYDTARDRINESESFDMAAVDLRLCEPAKKCKVQLISGKSAGTTGMVSLMCDDMMMGDE